MARARVQCDSHSVRSSCFRQNSPSWTRHRLGAAAAGRRFVAAAGDERPRALHEDGNAAHRLRVEHDAQTLLIHLSGEDGVGWTVFAVDRATRDWAVAQERRQADAARKAYEQLRPEAGT